MVTTAQVIPLLYPRAEPDFPDPRKVLGLPLSVLTVARPLVAAGFDVRIVDENVLPRARDRLEALARPLFVGISCLGGGQIRSGLELARTSKSLWPDVPVVWGGWSPTMLPHLYEDDALHELVDVVVRGRGEIPVLEIARRLQAGLDLDGIVGVSWRDDAGALRRNADGVLDDPREAAPLPFELVDDWDAYLTGDGILNFMSSYGCPHRCTFCGIPTQTQTFRPMEPARVVEQLLETRSRGIRSVVFYDDNFFTSRERVLELARCLSESNSTLEWHSNGRIDQLGALSDEELALIHSSGCRGINVGYETGDQQVADRVKKDVQVADVFELSRRLHEAGIRLSINFMVGLPGETSESLVRSLETLLRIHELHPGVEVCWYMFMPAPETEAWREMVRDGVLTEPATLQEHMRYQTMYLEHPWFYESPARDVMRDDRDDLKAITWIFRKAWAPPPRSLLLRPLAALHRQWCRRRFDARRFGLTLDWRFAFQWNALQTRVRWGLARLGRRRFFDRFRSKPRRQATGVPGVHPVPHV